ncbi:MAG: ribokinase [Fimbriimonadaceae bacterium]|nr:ribokinase [Fimbriimonadaceae bacterium]
MAAKLVVVGSANTDLVCQVPRLPQPGETVTGGTYFVAAGGKGANQAVAAARLGAAVTLVARLGDDSHGDAALAGYQTAGIDTRYLHRSPGASGVALILVQADGENLIAVAPGANARLTPADVASAAPAFAGAQAVLLQLEVPLPTVLAAARAGRAAGALVLLNPAPMPPDGLPPELLACCDVLTPNRGEAVALGGDPASLAPLVVVTQGAAGALVHQHGVVTAVPAPVVAAIDAVGAGDAFNGALAVGLAEGLQPLAAVRRACVAGALAATRLGAQPALPTRAEVDAWLAR